MTEVLPIFNEQTGAPAENPVERVLRERMVVGLANHTVLRPRDGREIPIEDSAAPIFNADGTVRGVILVFHDVTEKHARESALREAEWLSRTALGVAGAASFWWDPTQDHVVGDETLAHYFAVPPERCRDPGLPVATFLAAIHREDVARVQAAFEKAVAEGTPYHSEYRARDAAGTERWLDARGQMSLHVPGQPARLVGFVLDITARKGAELALAEVARLFALRVDVAAQLASGAELACNLQGVCALLVRHLDAAFARIWTLPEGEDVLHLRASAGLYTHLDGPHARVPVGEFKIGRIAQNREPLLTNDVAHDPNISDPAWAAREGMRAFAGYPLIAEGKLVGVLAIFSRQSFSEAVLGDLAPLCESISQCIERKSAEAELVAAKERAEVASRSKDHFLAALSHELRTPLTPVLMTAAALREDERLPGEVREQLGMMERNIALEARLIDDLLDLTRIATGKLRLREEACDAHTLIGLAVEIVRDEAQSKPIALTLDLAARRSGLHGDPARLQQVFWNLLRNSIKFTPGGGRITIRTRDEADGRLCIEVSDTGIGIAPDALDAVFHPFEQAAREGDHRFGGLGLGLAIARAIVELHGGTIRAESEGADRGASFLVELPRATEQPTGATDHPAPARALPATDGDFVHSLRLLLVEDHEPTLTVLSRLLTRAGHRVTAAGTVAAALVAAEASAFDLVISDLGLPDGTGLEAMSRLRLLQPGLLGIALSGYGMEDDLQRSRDCGFFTHLIKPVDFDQLRRAVRDATQPGAVSLVP